MNPKTVFVCLLYVAVSANGYSQKPVSDNKQNSELEMDAILKQGPEYDLIKPLIGIWKVIQTNYSNEGGKILARDSFRVEGKMIGNFLQEIMQPIVEKKTEEFTRISYLNYNRTNLRWEYIVLDTRYPITMFETSVDHQLDENKNIHVYLDAFIMPPFLGKQYAGMLTREHRIISFQNKDSYTHSQYWTLPGRKEFLAIKYEFTRQAGN